MVTFGRLSDAAIASKRTAIVVVAVVSLLLAGLGKFTRLARQPGVTDELSYLLASETYASGRMTNPSHPMWKHFEAEQILVVPTYQSRYPPGQGLVLALGRIVGLSPGVGVWLSFGILGAALVWMAQAWVGHRVAFFGTLAFMAWLSSSYWSFTYWGGSLAAIGGALVYGTIGRLRRKPRVLDGVLLGIGVLVLANTRMYEGLLTCLPAAAYFLYWLTRRDSATPASRRMLVTVPAAILLVAGAVFMARYNRAVTGSAATLPYVLYARQYDRSPVFLWSKARDSLLLREVKDRTKGVDDYRNERRPMGLLVAALRRVTTFLMFFVPLPLGLAVLLRFRSAARDRWIVGAAAVIGFALLAMSSNLGFLAHYAAPLTGLVLIVMLASLQALDARPAALGRLLLPSTLLWGCVGLGVARAVAYVVARYETDRTNWAAVRSRYADKLREAGGQHLVLVRYPRSHHPGYEWITNAADIDKSPVVWARERGPAEDQKLLDYFRNRSVWRVEMAEDEGPFTLVPVTPPARVDRPRENSEPRGANPDTPSGK